MMKKKLITENQQASVQDGKLIITKNGDFVVDVGYLIERKLPNGLVGLCCINM